LKGLEHGGSDECPLCQHFGPSCVGCPIAAYTSWLHCENTPHEEYVVAAEGSEEEKEAILAEIKFLKEVMAKLVRTKAESGL